jgi:hypothetical protein
MTIPRLEFPPFRLPPEAEALREDVRTFLKETLPKVKTETGSPPGRRRVQPSARHWGRVVGSA